MMKKIIILFLLLWVLVPCAYGETEAVETARQSVVHLYGLGTERETGRRIRWSGTGFAVGAAGEETDIFLTNWHVAAGSGKCEDGSIRLWLLKDGAALDANQAPLAGSAVECRVLATTDGYPDVAVLQTMEPVSGYRALPLLSSRRVVDGTQVYALGFAGLKDTNNGADSGPEDVTVTQGTITDHLIMTSAGSTRSVIHSAAIQHGFSGGPLVNEAGAVVAQNTYGFEEDVTTTLFCAVYIDYAMELLDGLGLPYTALSGPSPVTVFVADLLHRPGLSPAAAYALAGLAALGALVFAWYFIKTAKELVVEIKQKHRAKNNEEKEVQ